MGRWTLAMGLACAAVAAWGCNVFDESLAPPQGDGDGGGDTRPGCTDGSEEPPPRPDVEDGPPEDNIDEIVFALKDVTLDDPSNSLNVDETCSGPGGPWTCLPEEELGSEEPQGHIDGQRGRENQFSEEIFSLVNGLGFGEQDLQLTSRVSEAKGFGNPIIRIRDYNGEANDPRVTVVVTQSVFGVRGDGAGTTPDVCPVETENGAVPYEPDPETGCDEPDNLTTEIPPLDVTVDEEAGVITEFDPGWEAGDIHFWVRDDTFSDGHPDFPEVEDDLAYVSDWKLVVHLPDNVLFKLVGEGQAVQAQLTDAVAVGQLKEDLSGTEEQGVLVAGRWSVNALLQTASSVGVCPGEPLYEGARMILSEAADVRSDPATERPDVRCNSVSFGISFTAFRAHWGGLALGQPIPDLCEEGGGAAQ